jgi:signal peptidase I
MEPAARLTLAGAAAVVVGGSILWARRGLVAVTVEGLSMYPAYRPGDRVLVRRRSLAAVRLGDVVVVERPVPGSGWRSLPRPGGPVAGRQWILKRVAALPGHPLPEGLGAAAGTTADGQVPPATLVVLGDNPHSEDSRRWGPFPGERVLGVVVARLPRREGG